MNEIKKITDKKELVKYIFLVLITYNLTSCIGLNDDDPIIVGRNNTYRGILVDTSGNPIADKAIILKSTFNQNIAEFITDENGKFEGIGNIYDTGLELQVKNDGDFPNIAHRSFINYTFQYTEYPSGEIVEFPPLIYAPISSFNINVTNNTGEDYTAEIEYIIGGCNKDFEDNMETYSLCYENYTRQFNLGTSETNETGKRGVFALTGSTIVVTLTNDISTMTESFVIDEVEREENILFE